MQVREIAPKTLLYRGTAYQSLATALIRGRDALLVDALADRSDALMMRDHLEGELGVKVRVLVLTHGMVDHMAGVGLFPDAILIAHRDYLETYHAERPAPEEKRERADIEVTDELHFAWGRRRLRIFSNAGKTRCTLNVDLPDSDLVLCGDNLVGHIAYLSGAEPASLEAGLIRLQQLGRSRVVPGHMDVMPASALGAAYQYLAHLAAAVELARRRPDAPDAIRRIAIEHCLAPGISATAFEREWHGENLERVIERQMFLPSKH